MATDKIRADEIDEHLLELAALALRDAMRDDWEGATRHVVAISYGYGGVGLMCAICAWCDTLAARHPAMAAMQAGALVQLGWGSDESEGVETAGQVSPENRWAGQVVMTRARMDHETLSALITAIPQTREGSGLYIGALLQTVAITLTRIADGSVAERTAKALREGMPDGN